MKKKSSIDEKLAALNTAREQPGAPATLEALRDALGDRSGRVVAKAAKLVGELELAALVPALVAAFDQMLKDPVKSDPGCRAKNAILEALNRLEHLDPDVFLKGFRHVQLEPVWGGSEDTAAGLRGLAAFGLVQARYHDVAPMLVDLLADPEKPARVAAARALAWWGRPEAALLIRLKLLQGDPELEVMVECFDALLKLEGAGAVPFVSRFLKVGARVPGRPAKIGLEPSEDTVIAESAAMALGQSRCPEALEPLKRAWDAQLEPTFRQALLVAIALLRQPAGTAFLMSLIDEGGRTAAIEAVTALGPFLYDPALREEVARAVGRRGEAALRTALEEALAKAGLAD